MTPKAGWPVSRLDAIVRLGDLEVLRRVVLEGIGTSD
jgi:hypothetical protein